MQRFSIPIETSHQGRALFYAGAAFFNLPTSATFGDLAARIAKLRDHHVDPLSGIDVRLASAKPWLGAAGGGAALLERWRHAG